ncbi:hypothetical protein B0A48_15404 [Cryoendolithus antarcticus]|uniref:Phosphatidylserine decarboxylase n=1 Tax=Cryoendolithus antarcticus TaxID=1507870 RepID=A0A1V8SHW6_9PEZI|nr:hypothetical protein B0A48_15404 [Cryoendolithus antarcticus]
MASQPNDTLDGSMLSSITPATPAGKPLPEDHFSAAATTLDSLTTQAGDHATPPKAHLHIPGHHDTAHSLFRSVFPYDSLTNFEAEWHLGNYVIDRGTGEKSFEPMSVYVRLGMHLLYYGSVQAKALQSHQTQALLKAQSEKMGAQYDSPESVAHIQPFIESFELQGSLGEMVEPDPTKYATFNAFFAREIKTSARPVAEPENALAISSPADCRLTAFPTTDAATRYWIKGFGFTMARLLGSEPSASTFDQGSMVIARLAPQDYHRWHAPISGRVESITEIPGTYYTVNPQAINEAGTLDVFCENRRSVMLVRPTSNPNSLVAIIAVGAMLVGSIKYNPGIAPGSEIQRGQCLGAFYYGGSTVITLFPPGAAVLDEDLVANSTVDEADTAKNCETYVKVGWRVGQAVVQGATVS